MCLQCVVDSEPIGYLFDTGMGRNYVVHISKRRNEEWDIGRVGIIQINDPDFVLDDIDYLKMVEFFQYWNDYLENDHNAPLDPKWNDYDIPDLNDAITYQGYNSAAKFYRLVKAALDCGVIETEYEFNDWFMNRVATLYKEWLYNE